MGVFFNQGEVCCAGTRLFVEEKLHDEFADAVAKAAGAMKQGPGLDAGHAGRPARQPGAARARHRLPRHRQAGGREGAHRRRAQHGAGPRGRLLRQAHRLHRRPQRHADRAGGDLRAGGRADPVQGRGRRRARRATTRSTASPPACGRATSRRRTAWRARIRAGTVWVNCYNVFDVISPFGGYKQSGYGRELGRHALDLYTQVKSVWMRI